MPDYREGKIYIIRSPNTDAVYIGSTCQPLRIRMSGHTANYKRYIAGKDQKNSSFDILVHGKANIELIELYPCGSSGELLQREGEVMRRYPTRVNKNIAGGRTDVERDADIYIANARNLYGDRYNYRAQYDDDICRIIVSCRTCGNDKVFDPDTRARHLRIPCRSCTDANARRCTLEFIAEYLTQLGIEYICSGLRGLDFYVPKCDTFIEVVTSFEETGIIGTVLRVRDVYRCTPVLRSREMSHVKDAIQQFFGDAVVFFCLATVFHKSRFRSGYWIRF